MGTKTTSFMLGLAALMTLSLGGCGDDDGGDGDDGATDGGGAGSAAADASDAPDANGSDDAGADSGPAICEPTEPAAGFTGCEEDGDYAPCSDDGYAACVSDDGEYHRIEESISTIARVEAFEDIAALLFDPTSDPSPDDFLQARMLYQIDEGLDSRVVRRFDPHFEAPDGTDCTIEDMFMMQPDYCVGPATLQPMLLDAFNAGALGDAPREQAARIEGALLWFLYASIAKETLTCADVAKDCDSGYAYYTGGEAARGGIGLARYIEAADAYAHHRVWDGILAVRCWRDLDSAEVATDEALRERARDQVDRALLTGLAAVLRDRLEAAEGASGDEQAAHWTFVRTLGTALLREAEVRSADDAEVLSTQLAETDPTAVDFSVATDALTTLFACP